MTPGQPGHGGAYRVDESGELRQVEKPTEDHPRANRPRAADGTPLDGSTAETPAAEDKPAEPAASRRRAPPAIASASGD